MEGNTPQGAASSMLSFTPSPERRPSENLTAESILGSAELATNLPKSTGRSEKAKRGTQKGGEGGSGGAKKMRVMERKKTKKH